jgi:hypothetical protein
MDEPVRSRLGAGQRTPRPRGHRQHMPLAERPGQAAEQASGEKATPGNHQDHYQRPANQKPSVRIQAVDRGLGPAAIFRPATPRPASCRHRGTPLDITTPSGMYAKETAHTAADFSAGSPFMLSTEARRCVICACPRGWR